MGWSNNPKASDYSTRYRASIVAARDCQHCGRLLLANRSIQQRERIKPAYSIRRKLSQPSPLWMQSRRILGIQCHLCKSTRANFYSCSWLWALYWWCYAASRATTANPCSCTLADGNRQNDTPSLRL